MLPKNLTTLLCRQQTGSPIIEVAISGPVLSQYGPGGSAKRAIVFADPDVWKLHEAVLQDSFHSAYQCVEICQLQGGEETKQWDALRGVLERLASLRVSRRDDALFAVGGGTVLDVVGLAASIYRRGVALTKIPTSLMAQVDAAIGLKNAINFEYCKNLIGTFSPPYSVLVDLRFLETLPIRHWSNGISEIIKLGLVTNASLIRNLAKLPLDTAGSGDAGLAEIIRSAIVGTVKELNANPYEHSLRRSLDFGHWLSPLIEIEFPSTLHGEAVAIDMALSLTIALMRDRLSLREWNCAIELLHRWNLPLVYRPLTGALIQDALTKSAEHRGGLQNIPLCIGFGKHAFFNDITVYEVLEAQTRMLQHVDAMSACGSSDCAWALESDSPYYNRGNIDGGHINSIR